MSASRQWQESLILGKSEVFEADREYRTKEAEDRTFFNTETFENEYKLAQAYANVRILEYRGEGRLEVKTFEDNMPLLTNEFTALLLSSDLIASTTSGTGA